jgi:hypothetical protein
MSTKKPCFPAGLFRFRQLHAACARSAARDSPLRLINRVAKNQRHNFLFLKSLQLTLTVNKCAINLLLKQWQTPGLCQQKYRLSDHLSIRKKHYEPNCQSQFLKSRKANNSLSVLSI